MKVKEKKEERERERDGGAEVGSGVSGDRECSRAEQSIAQHCWYLDLMSFETEKPTPLTRL